MRKLLLVFSLVAGACGSGGDDNTGGSTGRDPRVAQCGQCPVNGGLATEDCCAPKDAAIACTKNLREEVSGTPCPGRDFEVTCWNFAQQRGYAQGCESPGFQCYAFMYSSNPDCCYETQSGWNGVNWVGPDGNSCGVAFCDGRQACD